MASQYFQGLTIENQNRYLEKIILIDNQDPYSLVNFKNDLQNIPQIQQADIMEYLLFRASPFTQKEIKAHKSISAFAQVVCKWVKSIQTTEIVNNRVVLGTVLHSERINEAPLKPWVILNAEGKILAGHCDCKAGLGEVCTHVAAVLYSLLRKPEESVTDKLAYWIAPKKLDVHLEVDEIDFTPPTSLWQKSASTVKSDGVTKTKTSGPLTREDVVTFLKDYQEIGCVSALHKILPPFIVIASTITEGAQDVGAEPSIEYSEENQTKHQQPTVSLDVIIKKALENNLTATIDVQLPIVALKENELKYFEEFIDVSFDTALEIAESTIEQSSSEWKTLRKRRITASRCYELYTYCKNKSPNWDRKIEGFVNPTFKGNKHTQHGKTYEPVARGVYQKQYGKVYQTGLIINPSLPWLACSPDGLKMTGGDFYRLVEFKCPSLCANTTVEEVISKLPYIKYDNRRLYPFYLNSKHKYYAQVQLSMAILNIQLCDFVIYSSHENRILVIEVKRDEEFISELIHRLHFVYFNYYLKKLVLH